jgi:hypothetical protein
MGIYMDMALASLSMGRIYGIFWKILTLLGKDTQCAGRPEPDGLPGRWSVEAGDLE